MEVVIFDNSDMIMPFPLRWQQGNESLLSLMKTVFV